MKNGSKFVSYACIGLLAGSVLSGCAVMTVDVDVYKGPLANKEDVQLQQFAALAIGAKPLLVHLRNELEWEGKASQYTDHPWYKDDHMAVGYAFEDRQAMRVNDILGLYKTRARPGLEAFTTENNARYRKYLDAIHTFAPPKSRNRALENTFEQSVKPEQLADASKFKGLLFQKRPGKPYFKPVEDVKDHVKKWCKSSQPNDDADQQADDADQQADDAGRKSWNWTYAKLEAPACREAIVERLFVSPRSAAAVAFERRLAEVSSAFRKMRVAIRGIWKGAVQSLIDIQRLEDDKARLALTEKMSQLVVETTQIELVAIAACAQKGKWPLLDQFCEHQAHSNFRLEFNFLERLNTDPVQTAIALLEADAYIRNVELSKITPCVESFATARKEGNNAEEIEPYGFFKAKIGREFGLAQALTIDAAKIETAFEATTSGSSLEQGRLTEGIEDLQERHLKLTQRASDSPQSQAARKNLNDALVRFATKVLFIADNQVLLAENSGAAFRKVDRFPLMLQAVGNSIIVHANDFERRRAHAAGLKQRLGAEKQALARQFSQSPAEMIDALIAALGEEKGVQAKTLADKQKELTQASASAEEAATAFGPADSFEKLFALKGDKLTAQAKSTYDASGLRLLRALDRCLSGNPGQISVCSALTQNPNKAKALAHLQHLAGAAQTLAAIDHPTAAETYDALMASLEKAQEAFENLIAFNELLVANDTLKNEAVKAVDKTGNGLVEMMLKCLPKVDSTSPCKDFDRDKSERSITYLNMLKSKNKPLLDGFKDADPAKNFEALKNWVDQQFLKAKPISQNRAALIALLGTAKPKLDDIAAGVFPKNGLRMVEAMAECLSDTGCIGTVAEKKLPEGAATFLKAVAKDKKAAFESVKDDTADTDFAKVKAVLDEVHETQRTQLAGAKKKQDALQSEVGKLKASGVKFADAIEQIKAVRRPVLSDIRRELRRPTPREFYGLIETALKKKLLAETPAKPNELVAAESTTASAASAISVDPRPSGFATPPSAVPTEPVQTEELPEPAGTENKGSIEPKTRTLTDKLNNAISALQDEVPPMDTVEFHDDWYAGGDRRKHPNARDVLDTLLASLRHEHVQAIRQHGAGSPKAKQLGEAIEKTLEHRGGMTYLRSATDYLRSSYAATGLQNNQGDFWQNMLVDHSSRSLPLVGPAIANRDRDRLRIQRDIDKQFWQNVNRVRVAGAGATNYAIAKDDVGNWYVKSYSADPEKIINSARNLALFNLGNQLDTDLLGRVFRKEGGTGNAAGDETDANRTTLGRIYTKYRDEYATVTNAHHAALVAMIKDDTLKSSIVDAWTSDAEIPDSMLDKLTAKLDANHSELKNRGTELEGTTRADGQKLPAVEIGAKIVTALRAVKRFQDTTIRDIGGLLTADRKQTLEKEEANRKKTEEKYHEEIKKLQDMTASGNAENPSESQISAQRQEELKAEQEYKAAKEKEVEAKQGLAAAERAEDVAKLKVADVVNAQTIGIVQQRLAANKNFETSVIFIGEANKPPKQEVPSASNAVVSQQEAATN